MVQLVTRTGCGRCMIVRNLLREKGIEYTMIGTDSDEGKEIIEKYNILTLPVVIKDGEVIKAEDVKNL